ncbi:DNA-directed RNA polymerase II subunit RPB1 [Eurytemora carolleeae]|uniref:DNA-directed RNA polymerase II subunit RPB1 n=1 Tax=Eurytemora carolleeae TaxID=1294199 RepID=UPI000C768B19|nr:DNA-directed RNA polymerase II subunit RPB1 [Eurytemora carolleeae]|eukprot:XP_023346469.1 DNA-directed RNA polymerase II subunit RPB1-like [Eurytemora affinis]
MIFLRIFNQLQNCESIERRNSRLIRQNGLDIEKSQLSFESNSSTARGRTKSQDLEGYFTTKSGRSSQRPLHFSTDQSSCDSSQADSGRTDSEVWISKEKVFYSSSKCSPTRWDSNFKSNSLAGSSNSPSPSLSFNPFNQVSHQPTTSFSSSFSSSSPETLLYPSASQGTKAWTTKIESNPGFDQTSSDQIQSIESHIYVQQPSQEEKNIQFLNNQEPRHPVDSNSDSPSSNSWSTPIPSFPSSPLLFSPTTPLISPTSWTAPYYPPDSPAPTPTTCATPFLSASTSFTLISSFPSSPNYLTPSQSSLDTLALSRHSSFYSCRNSPTPPTRDSIQGEYSPHCGEDVHWSVACSCSHFPFQTTPV